MMDFEIIETDRLKLRKVTPDVYDFIFQNYTNHEIKTFLGLHDDIDFHREREKYNEGLTTYNRSFLVFQLLDKNTETIIGSCGFHTWYLEHDRAEIGYALTNEQYRGKGFMTEAMDTIIAYGFNTMNLHRIEAFIGPNNTPSLQLIKNFHFTQEGHLREHFFKNNVMEDSLVFSLLKKEYKSK
ncbi:GNAT family N-acetyltransferase [Flavobacterium sp. '19STA2R22 D10 B1']|uniref:GNAT family N-acetyltransferase n=1 Tax=Flavobacterium aerium TaxID=3037261 RepID=UPI00278BBDE0|nr:GNAT family protein [Flavobacterium sp. '19STA2R22 D10 B1']